MPSTGLDTLYTPTLSAGGMMQITDIVRAAVAAGFRGTDLEIAVAIALAESGGNPTAAGDTSLANATWGPSVGLWQIRTLKDQTGTGGIRDINTLNDPLNNARAAFALYQARKARGQRGFEDWTTYTGATTSGAANSYTKRLTDVRQAVATVGGYDAIVADVERRIAAGQPVFTNIAGPPTPVPSGQTAAAPSAPVASRPATVGAGGAALGGAASTVTNPATAPRPGTNLTGAALDDFIRQNYGAMAWALNNPELGPILRRAATEGWDDGRLQSAIETSSWWKRHSAAERQFEILRNTDPAEAENQLEDRAKALEDRAVELGISLTHDRARFIAEKALTFAWDDNETSDALAAEFHYDPAIGLRGQAGAMAADFRQRARAYGVPVNEGLLAGWVGGIISGKATETDVDNYLKTQAKSRFGWDPGLVKAVDSGISPLDYYSPYISDAATLLERNPAELDLDNPLITAGISAIDPATGQRRPRSLYEYQTWLRSRPEWDRTHNATAEASALVMQLEQQMGVRV